MLFQQSLHSEIAGSASEFGWSRERNKAYRDESKASERKLGPGVAPLFPFFRVGVPL